MNNNNTKPLYNGEIPEDWEVKRLKDVAEAKGGYAFDSKKFKDTGMYQVVKMSNLYDNTLDLDRSSSYLDEADLSLLEKESTLEKDDIIMTLTGTTGKRDYGYSYQITKETRLLLNQRIAKISLKNSDSKYLFYAIKTNQFLDQFFYTAKGGTGNQANVGISDLLSLKILIPPLPEQRAIAQVLSTWDTAISKTQALIAQKELRKKWLMQNLLTGKKRLPAFAKASAGKEGVEEAWEERHLGEMFAERNETKFFDLPLLSVGASGIYPQSDSIKKDTSNEDKSKYKRIYPGDIGYNTMRMWQGRSALSDLEGIVSPAYTIVTPREKADSIFFSYLFKTPKLMNLFWRNSQGLVDDTLNCKFKDFEIIKVKLPNTKEEQTAIAQVLQAADKEIQLLKTKTERLREQKKGLMQVLLTGKKRLTIKQN